MGAVLALATVVAYLPALGGGFLWDDNRYVTPLALQSGHGLWRIWFEPGASEQYYPLLHSLFWVQHLLWGDHPLGYHCFTLLAHVTASLLLGCVLKRLAVPGAWLAAMLFALHPVHAESVAWIAEQKNTISLVCFLAAAFAYLQFDVTRRKTDYAAAVAWFVLSLLSKTVTVTLPAALLVVLWWKRGSLQWRRDVRPLFPWLVLGASAGLFSSWIEKRFLGAEGGAFELSFVDRFLVAGRAVWFYVGHLAWPFGLNFIYPRWKPDSAAPWQWIMPVCAVAAAAAFWGMRRWSRTPLAAYLIFVGTLFPVLGFVNLYGALYSFVWDHWQYLPDIAPLAVLGAGLALAPRRGSRWVAPVLTASLALFLGGLTWARCATFRDNEVLYRTTLRRNPDCWMAENNLAFLLTDSGRTEEAIVHYQKALTLGSNQPAVIHNNLGIAYSKVGRNDEAILEYESALRVAPDYVDALNNLGIAFAKKGRIAEAIPCFERALKSQPGRADIRASLERARLSVGLPGETTEALAEAARKAPESAQAHVDLGASLEDSGRHAEAAAEYGRALQLHPDFPEAVRNDLGIALANEGRLSEAITQFQEVVRLKPDSAEARENLAAALLADGRPEEAALQHKEAVRIDPSLASQPR